MTKPDNLQTRRARRGGSASRLGWTTRRRGKSKGAVAPAGEMAPEVEALPPLIPLAGPATPPARPGGKLGQMVDLLRRPEGARVDELMDATGWQSHTVRGAMSGALKGRLKLAITSEPGEAGRVYRILDEVGA